MPQLTQDHLIQAILAVLQSELPEIRINATVSVPYRGNVPEGAVGIAVVELQSGGFLGGLYLLDGKLLWRFYRFKSTVDLNDPDCWDQLTAAVRPVYSELCARSGAR